MPATWMSPTMRYAWNDEGAEHELRMVPVQGTAGTPFLFGAGAGRRPIEVRDFRMSTTQVTQALWTRVMGSNPAVHRDLRCPVENVSWHHVADAGGFLDRINASDILPALTGGDTNVRFRLPSETEWEYAARGGVHWRDDTPFSGSRDIDRVAWYGRRWKGGALKWEIVKRLMWWGLMGRGRWGGPTHTHPVATKDANQLGIYDMSGNVWEWCADVCVDDLDAVPADGSPYLGPGTDRRLRGGCHHNWDIHCTVWWRYGITPDAHDGCLGFRLVLA